MAKKSKAVATGSKAVATEQPPRALILASRGIVTSRDFANVMSALMTDLLENKVPSGISNAVCNAGGKLLKVIELQAKYGKALGANNEKILTLATEAVLSLPEKPVN